MKKLQQQQLVINNKMLLCCETFSESYSNFDKIPGGLPSLDKGLRNQIVKWGPGRHWTLHRKNW